MISKKRPNEINKEDRALMPPPSPRKIPKIAEKQKSLKDEIGKKKSVKNDKFGEKHKNKTMPSSKWKLNKLELK